MPSSAEQRKAFEDEVRLLIAERYAWDGRLADAEEALLTIGGGSARALDLLGRVRFQQGRPEEAARCFRDALALCGVRAPARAALARLASLRTRPFWVGPLLVFLALVAGTFVLLGVLKIHDDRLLAMLPRPREADSAGVPAAVQRLAAGIAGLRENLGEVLERGPAREAAPVAAAAQPQVIRLSLPIEGVDVRRKGSGLVLSFARNLFGEGIRMNRRAKETLHLVAQALAGHGEAIRLVVSGTSDRRRLKKDSPFHDERDLRLRRADAVIRELMAPASLPAELFSIGTAEPDAEGIAGSSRWGSRSAVIEILSLAPGARVEDAVLEPSRQDGEARVRTLPSSSRHQEGETR